MEGQPAGQRRESASPGDSHISNPPPQAQQRVGTSEKCSGPHISGVHAGGAGWIVLSLPPATCSQLFRRTLALSPTSQKHHTALRRCPPRGMPVAPCPCLPCPLSSFCCLGALPKSNLCARVLVSGLLLGKLKLRRRYCQVVVLWVGAALLNVCFPPESMSSLGSLCVLFAHHCLLNTAPDT